MPQPTATIDLPGSLTEQINVQRDGEPARTVPATTVAPGLAITQHLNRSGSPVNSRYALIAVTTGKAVTWNLCPTHIAAAVAIATEIPIDWSRDEAALKADPRVRDTFVQILDFVPSCNNGVCPGGEVNVAAWCAYQAGRFRTYEDREMAMYPEPEFRDTALVEWVIRVLSRPDNPGTAEVLEAIDRQRVS